MSDDKQTEISSNPIAYDERQTVDTKLLELLVCPLTKSSLDYNAERNELISRQARLAFPIVDGIPLLTPEAARSLKDEDLP